jgi:hypothetical protein
LVACVLAQSRIVSTLHDHFQAKPGYQHLMDAQVAKQVRLDGPGLAKTRVGNETAPPTHDFIRISPVARSSLSPDRADGNGITALHDPNPSSRVRSK